MCYSSSSTTSLRNFLSYFCCGQVLAIAIVFIVIIAFGTDNKENATSFVTAFASLHLNHRRYYSKLHQYSYHQPPITSTGSQSRNQQRTGKITKERYNFLGDRIISNPLATSRVSNNQDIRKVLMKACLHPVQSSTGLCSANDDEVYDKSSSKMNELHESEYQLKNPNQSLQVISENLMGVSFLNLIGKTTSIVVAGIFFITLSYQRDAFMISFFIGSIMNAILSKVLKRFINQTRPQSSPSTATTISDSTISVRSLIEQLKKPVKPSDNGMPSSHAMSLGFIGTFVICQLVMSSSSLWTIITIPVLVAYCAISLWYRIHIQLHTLEQILVGSIIGTMNGYIWYQICVYGSISWDPTSSVASTSTFGIVERIHRYGTLHSFFNDNGQCSILWLLIPAFIGAATVGSIERRITFSLPPSSISEKKKDTKAF
jgi:PAP2 superfamily